MSQFDRNTFLAHFPLLQYMSDEQRCWNELEQSIREFAKHNASVGEAETLPFKQWWDTAFSMMASRQIQINDLNFAPEKGEDEFIELKNSGPAIIDLTGWRINAGTDTQNVELPEGMLLLPNETVRIYTHHSEQLSFNSSRPIWNNKGDKASVFDQQGTLVTSWVYREDAHNHIVISHINFDGEVQKTEADEFVELTSVSAHWLDLSGWILKCNQSHIEFHFPKRSHIAPNQSIRIYTNQIHPESGGYSFGSHKAIWNNKGGGATLLDDRRFEASSFVY